MRDGARPETSAAGGRLRRLELWLFPPLAAAVAASLYFPLDKVRDFDGLWHLRHAWVYATRGLLYHEFPWTSFSVVRTCAADDWYGFHLLLVPFAGVSDPLLQVRLAGTVVTCLAFLLLWGAARLLRLGAAWVWPLVVALGSAATVHRYAMIRPQVLSNALGLLLLPVLVYGRLWQILLLSAFFSFVHFNVFWIPLLVAGAYVVVSYLVSRELPWRRFLVVLAGLALGWLLRPNPGGAVRLVYIQTLGWAQTHLSGAPVEVPRELLPMPLSFLKANFLPLLLVWLLVMGLWLWVALRRPQPVPAPRRVLLWTTFALGLLFFEMTVNLGARASDQWLLFGFAFVGLALTTLGERAGVADFFRRRRALAIALAALALVAVGGNAAWAVRSSAAAVEQLLPNPLRLRPACEYLRAHAQPGTLVFSAQWGLFPELFYWDPQNYYVGGMDPVFQYAYSPDLFFKAAHMREGDGSQTCGQPVCRPGETEDTYRVLRRDFHARYLLVHRLLDAPLAAFAQRDPRFALRFEDPEFQVFELKP